MSWIIYTTIWINTCTSGPGCARCATVVPNGENPPNIMKFLTCYIIDSYWNSDLADSENGIFELFRSPNSAQKRSDFHLSALKILIFNFLYRKISIEGFKKVVFPNQRAPKSRIWVVQIKPYSILVAPETLHFWASANILRLLIELVFNFWQKLGIHFEFWTCWFDRIFVTIFFFVKSQCVTHYVLRFDKKCIW